MYREQTSDGTLIESELIDKIDGVVHGFGVRGKTQVNYLDALGIKDRYILDTNQIHGDVVHYLVYPKGGSVMQGDAFITDRPGLVCYVRTADCVPILIADTKTRGIAAVHAGWRGTARNVVAQTLKAMREMFDTNPADCVAAVGPSICGKCYEVGSDVVEALKKVPPLCKGRLGGVDPSSQWLTDSTHVDVRVANVILLESAGIPKENIDISSDCTHCDDTFNSWRRDHSEDERQFSFVMLT